MCFGAPTIDTTVQDQQLTEAAETRWRESERQARIKAGAGFLDDVFGGGIAGGTKLGADAVYDPNATYYTASGDVWRPLTISDVWATSPKLGAFQVPDAEKQFQDALKNGLLYADTKEVRGFDDAFFDERKNAYMGFYKPQLDDQFKSAQDQLTYGLARAGTLNSTMAADKQAELKTKYDVQNASLLSQADAEVAAMKNRINNEKSALIAQLNATGDADRVSNEALGRTQQMFHEKPAYSPIGDIFAGVATGIGNYWNARQNTALHNAYFGARSPNAGRSGVYTVR